MTSVVRGTRYMRHIDVSRSLGNPEIDVETNVNVYKGAGQYFFPILTNLSREFHIWQ